MRARQQWRTILYFLGTQLFFLVMIVSFSMGGKTVFGVLIALPPLIAVATMSRRGILFIFYFMCLIFVVGQRTIYIGPQIRMVPCEILLWGLAAICVGYKGASGLKTGRVPLAAWVLFVATLFSIYSTSRWAYYDNQDINVGIGYAKMMWMAIPAYFICGRLVQRFEVMEKTLTIISLGCFFLSFLALSEYFHLGFVHYFGGFIDAKARDLSGAEGFHRLGATFWGGPMLAGYLTVCFPLILTLWMSSKSSMQKMILSLSMILTFLVIYFSGHRGLWVALVFAIGCYFYLKGLKGIFILLILAALGLQFAPKIAKDRIMSLSGQTEDSSARKRKDRAEFAWKMVQRDPIIGNGWGASGLVHSDFLQLWADAGGFSFAALLCLFGQTFVKIWVRVQKVRNKIHREYYCGFFAAGAGAFVILANQAWFNLPEQYVPFWVVMALAFQFPNVAYNENKIAFHSVIQKIETEKKQNA